jgi:hypothetical protein
MSFLGFERQNALVLVGVRQIIADQMLEEGTDRGESVIPAGHFVPSLGFQMSQEGLDSVDIQVTQLQVGYLAFPLVGDEHEQKAQSVPISADGVRTHTAHPFEIFAEE